MEFNHYKVTSLSRENKALKQLCDIHKGKRCFIIATGPSLTLEDLELLKDEICIGVNSIAKSFSKTKWRPQYLCIMDGRIWPKVKKEVETYSSEISKIFLGHNIHSDVENAIYIKRDEIASTYLETEYYKTHNVIPSKYTFYIPKHLERYLCDGSTVVISAIQFAIYMGCNEIYLLGTDCNYQKNIKYSDLTKYDNIPLPDNVENKMFSCYKSIRSEVEAMYPKVSIYNATRGGMLEVFERKDLDTLFM